MWNNFQPERRQLLHLQSEQYRSWVRTSGRVTMTPNTTIDLHRLRPRTPVLRQSIRPWSLLHPTPYRLVRSGIVRTTPADVADRSFVGRPMTPAPSFESPAGVPGPLPIGADTDGSINRYGDRGTNGTGAISAFQPYPFGVADGQATAVPLDLSGNEVEVDDEVAASLYLKDDQSEVGFNDATVAAAPLDLSGGRPEVKVRPYVCDAQPFNGVRHEDLVLDSIHGQCPLPAGHDRLVLSDAHRGRSPTATRSNPPPYPVNGPVADDRRYFYDHSLGYGWAPYVLGPETDRPVSPTDTRFNRLLCVNCSSYFGLMLT